MVGAGLTLAAPPLIATAQASDSVARVVVSGSRFIDPADVLPVGVAVLTDDDLKGSGVSNVNEAVMRLLGVPARLDLSGGGEYGLDLRGFGSGAGANQVVVVDGLRMSEADLGSTRLADIPIDSIVRIEVRRGSGAVLYGEGATAGVIAITTRSGLAGSPAQAQAGSGRPTGQVLAGGAGDGQRELRGNATIALRGLTLDAGASRRLADGHRDNFASATSAGGVGLRWQQAGFSLAARHGEDRLASGLPGSLSANQFDANPRQASTPADSASLLQRRTTLQAGVELPGGWTLAADGGWRSKASRSDYLSLGSRYDYDVRAEQWTLRARHTATSVGYAHALTFGVDDNRWQREVLGSFGSQADQHNRGVFAQGDVTLAGGTRLGSGVRREAVIKQLDTAFGALLLERALHAWELSVLQPLAVAADGGGGAQVFARIGRSFRLANVDEFSFTRPGASLRPQTSQDTEVGLRWTARGQRLEARLWRSALHDEIGYDPAEGAFGANVNFDRTRRRGLELEGHLALRPGLELRGNLAWRQAHFASGPYVGKAMPLVAQRSAAFGAAWQPWAGHALDAWLRAFSSQHPDLANDCRLPGVAVLDLRWAHTLADLLPGRLAPELALQVSNATDRRFATQAYACSGGRATALYPEPGRVVSGTLRLAF